MSDPYLSILHPSNSDHTSMLITGSLLLLTLGLACLSGRWGDSGHASCGIIFMILVNLVNYIPCHLVQ